MAVIEGFIFLFIVAKKWRGASGAMVHRNASAAGHQF